MSAPTPKTAGSEAAGRRLLMRRYLLIGIASLSVVCAIGLSIWASGLPLSWVMDCDSASYYRINKVIAADPKHLGDRRLYDVIPQLGLEDVPWDDGNMQNLAGSCRIYHFRGFALIVNLEYMRPGVTEDILLERGTPEEKFQARDLLVLNRYQPPFTMLDGIKTREERMRRYWASAEESVKKINEEMESRRRRALNQRN
jgi:hypothetical protein